MSDCSTYILIDTPEKRLLFAPKRAADECWQPTTSGWEQTKFPHDNFSDQNQYRRLERNAWLPIKDKPVQYPAWIVLGNGEKKYVEHPTDCERYTATHWLPAPPAPEGPVDESLSECERQWEASQHWSDAKNSLLKNAAIWGWQAGRDYERSKKP